MVTVRARGWVFTLNNPIGCDEEQRDKLIEDCKYLIIGNEVGESGTPHWQGFVYFTERRSFIQVKQYLARAHWEPQKGSNDQAITYCMKEGSYTEYGAKPTGPQGQDCKWKEVLALARQGKLDQIEDKHPAIFIRYYAKLASFYRPEKPIILETLENEWWHGKTGTGKSRRLWQLYPKQYNKSLNKWWDGYANQETVAIEEWSPKHEITASFLKIWADRYPFTAEIKGGTLQYVRPKRIIILSNYTMEECFTNSQDLEPIKRRFKTIHFATL